MHKDIRICICKIHIKMCIHSFRLCTIFKLYCLIAHYSFNSNDIYIYVCMQYSGKCNSQMRSLIKSFEWQSTHTYERVRKSVVVS